MKTSDTQIGDVESEKLEKPIQEFTAASARAAHVPSYALPPLLLQPACSCSSHCSTITTGVTLKELF